MKCENLQFNLSIYIDHGLTDDERAATDAHLAACPLCRQKLDDFRDLRRRLQKLAPPAMPKDLLASVKQSVRAELAPAAPKKPAYFSKGFLEFLQMRVMPLAVGTTASLVLGFSLLWILLSTSAGPTSDVTARRASDYFPVTSPAAPDEIALTDFVAQRGLVSSESPSVNPHGALMDITKSLVSGKSKDGEFVVLADVGPDGLVEIEEVVKPLDDQQTVYELEKAMRRDSTEAPFVPAFLDRRAESVRVVLKIQRVDVKVSQPKARKR